MSSVEIPESLRDQPLTLKQKLWRKLGSQAKRAGQELVETSLKLYFSARDERTPAWARAVIYASIAYFIVPIDGIPDLLPTGYSDDLATLLAALATVSAHIKTEHKTKAHDKLVKWFPQLDTPNSGKKTAKPKEP